MRRRVEGPNLRLRVSREGFQRWRRVESPHPQTRTRGRSLSLTSLLLLLSGKYLFVTCSMPSSIWISSSSHSRQRSTFHDARTFLMSLGAALGDEILDPRRDGQDVAPRPAAHEDLLARLFVALIHRHPRTPSRRSTPRSTPQLPRRGPRRPPGAPPPTPPPTRPSVSTRLNARVAKRARADAHSAIRVPRCDRCRGHLV